MSEYSPCTMLCGLTNQYKTCSQVCLNMKHCDALKCRASDSSEQSCPWPSICGPMTCDSKKCHQFCSRGNCNSMKCPRTVKSCYQFSASEMSCEADSCTQKCDRPDCQMTCPDGGDNCIQFLSLGGASMECDRNVCEQNCFIGRCNMSCSSSVKPGRCEQGCTSGTCESMVCNATNCSQACVNGECVMDCPVGVKSCTQTAYNKNVTMRCDGDVCKQICYSASCNMT